MLFSSLERRFACSLWLHAKKTTNSGANTPRRTHFAFVRYLLNLVASLRGILMCKAVETHNASVRTQLFRMPNVPRPLGSDLVIQLGVVLTGSGRVTEELIPEHSRPPHRGGIVHPALEKRVTASIKQAIRSSTILVEKARCSRR